MGHSTDPECRTGFTRGREAKACRSVEALLVLRRVQGKDRGFQTERSASSDTEARVLITPGEVQCAFLQGVGRLQAE